MPITLHRTIGEIDAGEWNQLSCGNPFATHGWLKTVETTWRSPVEPLYFALRREGELIAGAVCYAASPTDESETLDDLVFGRFARTARTLGFSFLPAIVCGPVLGYGWHVGTSACLCVSEADEARACVLNAIEAEAGSRGLKVSFVQVLDEERELRNLLERRRYLRCRNVPVSVLDIRWRSFDDYLAHLSVKQGKEFRRQTKRCRDSGNVVETPVSATLDEGRLLDLIDGTARKHGSRRFAAGEGFLRELTRNMGAGAKVFTIGKAGRVAGVCIVLGDPPEAVGLAVGVEPEADANDYAYFQVTYYSPIADAIERGIERLYYGREMYEIKLRRGCRLTNTWIYSNHSGPPGAAVKMWYAAASRWNRWKLPAAARRALE